MLWKIRHRAQNKILNLILRNIIAKAAKITEKENNVEFMEIL